MALLKDYKGQEDSDPGRWYPYREDPDTGKMAQVRARRCPAAVRERIRKDFEVVDYFTPPGKKQAIKRLVVPEDKEGELAIAVLAYSFVDVKDFPVELGSDEAVEMYQKELRASFSVGETVMLDGRLTRALKFHLLDELRDLFILVGQVAAGNESATVPSDDEVRQREKEREEALRQNLQSGSSSSFDGTPKPEAENVAEVAAQ